MQTRQKTLSGSTARSEGSPAKYLGIVNISVNKEEMLALLPLASFCTTSRVTVWAMGGAGFKRHKPQSGSPSAACDSPPNLSILLQLPRTCLRWLKLLKTGLIFRSRLLTKSVVLLWRFSIEETNALWEKKKKRESSKHQPWVPSSLVAQLPLSRSLLPQRQEHSCSDQAASRYPLGLKIQTGQYKHSFFLEKVSPSQVHWEDRAQCMLMTNLKCIPIMYVSEQYISGQVW